MGSRFIRFFIVLIMALVIAGVRWIGVNAQEEIPPPAIATTDHCASCHSEVYVIWHKGAHGDAQSKLALAQQGNCFACHKSIPEGDMFNPTQTSSAFNSYWVEQGKPNNCLQCHVSGYDPATGNWKSHGITCDACHNPIPSNHPVDTMPLDKNADMCRTCHTDARFGWDTWKESVHYQANITCITCHSPHSTSLKQVGQASVDASALCENCHKDVAQNAEFSIHANAGATCVTCHIGTSKGADDFHKVPDHDFKPKLEACNSCHADQMHNAGLPASITTTQGMPIAVIEASLEPEPLETGARADVSPFGFAGLLGFLGVIGGVMWSKIQKRRPPN